MDPLDYVKSLKHRWKLIVVCVLIALPVGWFLSPETPDPTPPTRTTFKATTHLFAAQTSTSVRTPYSILQELATRAKLGEVPERAAEVLEFEGGVDAFLAHIDVVPDETRGLLSVTATAPTAQRAELMANTLVDELLGTLDRRMHRRIQAAEQELAQVERRIARLGGADEEASTGGNKGGTSGDASGSLESRRQTLTQQLAELRSSLRNGSAGVEVLQPAIADAVTAGTGLQAPRSRGVRLLLAAMIGLIVGVAIALMRERLDPRIRDREQAEDAFTFPVLAEVPTIPRRRRSGNVGTVAPGTLASNAFQLLAAALRFGRHPAPTDVGSDDDRPRGRTILVTSTAQSEGKSTTVANLAAAFAEFGNRVIVLCCDVHRPTLHDTFGVPQGPGLSDVLTVDDVTFRQVVHQTMLERVEVIPAGMAPGDSVPLLSSVEMHNLLVEATSAADIVLVDAAPVLATSDWTQLLPEVDEVLLVARAGATTWASAERAAGILEMLQAPVAGIALNGVAASSMRRGYGYRYQASSRTGEAEATPAATSGRPDPDAVLPSPLPGSLGDAPTSDADGNRLAVSGNGRKEDPVVTSDLDEAAKALREGKRVRLKHERRSGSVGFLELTRVTSSISAEESPTDDEPTDDEPIPTVIDESHDRVRTSMDRP